LPGTYLCPLFKTRSERKKKKEKERETEKKKRVKEGGSEAERGED